MFPIYIFHLSAVCLHLSVISMITTIYVPFEVFVLLCYIFNFCVLLMFTLPVSEVWCISSPYMVFIPFSSLKVTHLGKIVRPVVCLILYQTAYLRLCRRLCLNLKVKVNIFVLLVELMFWMALAPWFWMITKRQNSSSGSSLPMDAFILWGFYKYACPYVNALMHLYTNRRIATNACTDNAYMNVPL